MTGFINTGVSALIAFQRALATTSHNISNANTEGYSRQRVELVTRQPQEFGNGFVGQGVAVRDIERFTDQFIKLQLQQATAESARLEQFGFLAGQIDNLLSDEQGSISPVLQRFFSSLQDVANDAASIPARQVMLSEAQNLVDRFNFLELQFNDQNAVINRRIGEIVDEVNSIAAGIASLNQEIIAAFNNASVSQPNDLLDRRDQLVLELSELVSVDTLQGNNGALNVFIGNGQMLVFDTNVQRLSATGDSADLSQTSITYEGASGNFDIASQLGGGELGALLDFRRDVLTPAQNDLGRVAIVLADTFNAQHRQGMDLNSALGGNFFNVPPPTVTPNQGNSGTATASVTFTDVTALTASDYQLTYDGTNFTLTRLNDNTSVTGPGPLSMDGFDLSITAGAVAGDSFLVRPTHGAAGQVSLAISNVNNIAAASPVRSEAAVSNLGDASIALGQILDITNADLLDTVEIVFNDPPTTFNVVNTTDASTIASGVTYTSGGNIDFNGLRFSISGTPAAGDTFTVEHNIGGISDNRNALLLTDLQIQSLVGGTASYQEAYAGIIGRVGTQVNQAEVNAIAQNNILDQLQQQRDAISGVNLDEEAADLLRFQQAYEAAAQIISVSDSLFETLLNSVS